MLASTCWGTEPEVESYQVLESGATWTYQFRYWEEGRFAMEKIGKVVHWIDGTIEWGGHQYYRLRTKNTGFKNASDADVLIRVAEDSVRSVNTGKASPEEVLKIPLPAVPGRTWSIAEGAEKWHYTLESAEPVEIPAGRFEDCIAIVTKLESKTSKFEISLRSEYCSGVGFVRMRSKAVHEYGASNSEQILLEFKH
jgi:hypothetical protein